MTETELIARQAKQIKELCDEVEALKRLALRVEQSVVLGEREACAKICDRFSMQSSHPMNFSVNCAEAIRRRKEEK